jgi:hypothetical protein
MTVSNMMLLECLGKSGIDLEGEYLEEETQLVAQLATECDAEEKIGAGGYG